MARALLSRGSSENHCRAAQKNLFNIYHTKLPILAHRWSYCRSKEYPCGGVLCSWKRFEPVWPDEVNRILRSIRSAICSLDPCPSLLVRHLNKRVLPLLLTPWLTSFWRNYQSIILYWIIGWEICISCSISNCRIWWNYLQVCHSGFVCLIGYYT